MALWLVCCLLCIGCERSREGEGRVVQPNVVVITVDTLRADRLGCYGYEKAHTPHIDSLAREGVRAKHAIAATPLTLPSHASLFTGLEPPAHGVRSNGSFELSDDAVTLAERLKAAGYRTRAFVSAMVLHRSRNLDQGFDEYDDELWSQQHKRAALIRERSANSTMNLVLGWLDSNSPGASSNSPYFLWVHLFDPHAPYRPPAEDAKRAPTPYDGEIASVDRQIGRLLEALRTRGELDDTILVFTSDHGESLGEHGESTHAIFIYQSTVHIPWIVRFPAKLPVGRVYEGPVRTVDLMPTVLGLAGLAPGESQGTDLSRAFAGEAPSSFPLQYSESLYPELEYGMAPLYGLRSERWTYIRAPRPELYDRVEDPGETRNLLDASHAAAPEESQARAAEFDQKLSEMLANSERIARVAKATPIDAQTAEMLKALGYAVDPEAKQGMEGMDPKDGLPIYAEVQAGRQLMLGGKYAECIKRLKPLLRQMPKLVSALNTTASCEQRLRRTKGAAEHYRKSLEVTPGQEFALIQLGRVLIADRQIEEARGTILKALDVVPDSMEAMSLMGYVEIFAGQLDAAAAWFHKSIEADPNFSRSYVGLGDLRFGEQKYAEAMRWYEKAVEIQHRHTDAWLQAATCAIKTGDTTRARKLLESGARANPGLEQHPKFEALAKRLSAPERKTRASRVRSDTEN